MLYHVSGPKYLQFLPEWIYVYITTQLIFSTSPDRLDMAFLAPAVDFQGSHRWSFQCCCSQGIRPSKWMLHVWHGSILWTSHAWSIEQLASFRYRWWRSQLKLWTSWMIFLAWPSVCWVGDVNEVGHPCQQNKKCHVNIMMDVEGKKFCKARGWRWKI